MSSNKRDLQSKKIQRKTKKPISPSVKEALAQRKISNQNKKNSIPNLKPTIQNITIQTALEHTQSINLITNVSNTLFPELPSILTLLDDNSNKEVDEIIRNLKNSSIAQSNHLALLCMTSVFKGDLLITPEDIKLSFSKQSSIELLAKLYHANFTSKLIKYANTFINEENLDTFYAEHTEEIQQDYILNIKEYYTFCQNIMNVIKTEKLEKPVSKGLESKTIQSISELNTKIKNIKDNSKYYLYNKIKNCFINLIRMSQNKIDELAQLSSAEDSSLFQFIQNAEEFDSDIDLPESLIYILIDELQDDRNHLSELFESISKIQYDFLSFISKQVVSFKNESTLIESLSPEILNLHLKTHKDYQLVKKLIHDAITKFENHKKCLPVVNQLITLSEYMAENNRIISDIIQKSKTQGFSQQDELETILEAFNDIRIAYEQYIEELQEALSNVDNNIMQVLYDIKEAHTSKINSIFELRPKNLISEFNIQNAKPNGPTIQARESLNTAVPFDTQQFPNHETKTPHYPEASTANTQRLMDSKNKKKTKSIQYSKWDTDNIRELTRHINTFLNNINVFNETLCNSKPSDEALKDAIYALKRTFALKQNAYRRVLSENNLPEAIEKNTSITEQSLLTYLKIIDEFCSFGSRAALRLFFIQNHIPQLAKIPNLDLLGKIERCLQKIPHELKSSSFLARENKIKERFKNIEQITYTNNNLTVILKGELLHHSIDAIQRILPQNIISQISDLYSQSILLKTKEIQTLQLKKYNSDKECSNNEKEATVGTHEQQLQNWKNLSPHFQIKNIGNYFSRIERILYQYQTMVQRATKLKIKYGHTFDVRALVKYEQCAKQCDILHGKIIQQYHDTLQLLEYMSHIDSISPELMMLLAPFKNHIFAIELQKTNVLLHIEYKKDSTPLKSFVLHFKLGLFFANKNSAKQTEFTKALCMGMHTYFKANTLIDMTMAAFHNTDLTCEHNNALIFIRTIINMDMKNELFHYKGLDNNTSIKLHDFLNSITAPELTPIVNEIKHLIIDKKDKNKANYFNVLNRLALKSPPFISKEDLSIMIYDLVYQLKNMPRDQHTNIVAEFRDILHYTHPVYFDVENDNVLSPNSAVQTFIHTANHQNLMQSDNETLINFQEKKENSQTTEHEISSSIKTIKHVSQFKNTLTNIENIAKSNIESNQQDILVKQIINMTEQIYQQEVLNIGSTELICSALNLDHINASDGLYKTPDSLHINKIEELNVKLEMLFSAIIFFEYHNGILSPRQKLKECENIIHFYENILCSAIDNHSYRIFEIIYNTLTKNHILRLCKNTNNIINKFGELFKNNKRTLTKLVKKHNGIPLLDISKNKLIDLIESQTISLPSKFITIGQEALQLSAYQKRNIYEQKKQDNNSYFVNFINSYLSSIHSSCYYAPYVQDYVFDKKISPYDLPHLSLEIKPEEIDNAISITEFKNISALINYLHNCSNKGWGYNLIESNPREKIIEFMTQQIEGDPKSFTTDIPDFNESMSIFKLFDDLEAKNHGKQH